ncbi:MAG: DUF4870 domain-containing protein [Planctomycetota bacterium]
MTGEPVSKEPPVQDAQTGGKDERMWAMLCHLSSLVGFIIPLGNIIAPLVIWMIKKEEYPLVEDQGKESVNFQITLFIAVIVVFVLMFVVIGVFLMPILLILWVVFVIMASMKANNGERYRYPVCIRFIK